MLINILSISFNNHSFSDQAEAHRQKAKAARERRVVRQAKKKADLLGLNTEEEEEEQTTTQK